MKTNKIIHKYLSVKVILTTLLFLIGFSFSASAQNEPQSSKSNSKIKSADWQLLLSNEYVVVSYKYEQCNLPMMGTFNENVYLQIKNKTTIKLKVEWNSERWYNDKCIGCKVDDIENRQIIDLKPNEALEGFCSEKSERALILFSKMLNYEIESQLTNFNIRDLKITPLSN